MSLVSFVKKSKLLNGHFIRHLLLLLWFYLFANIVETLSPVIKRSHFPGKDVAVFDDQTTACLAAASCKDDILVITANGEVPAEHMIEGEAVLLLKTVDDGRAVLAKDITEAAVAAFIAGDVSIDFPTEYRELRILIQDIVWIFTMIRAISPSMEGLKLFIGNITQLCGH